MISVIVPAYNIAPYIERCIKSILDQTYTDFEILIVNDGSTDETPLICDRLAAMDSRIRVFHKENGGVSSARNLALTKIKGELISMIDGDDWIEPNLFEDAVHQLNTHNAQVFMFEYFIDKNESSVKHSLNDELYGIINTETTMINTISSNNRFLWSKIFSAELVKDTNFDENIILGEDTLFICEIISRATKCVYSDNSYYHYIIRENSAITSNFKIKKMTGLIAYDKVLHLFKTQGYMKAADYARAAIVDLAVALSRKALKSPDKKQAYTLAKKQIKSIAFKTLTSKNVSLKTKAKTFISIFSIDMAVKFCNLMGEKTQ